MFVLGNCFDSCSEDTALRVGQRPFDGLFTRTVAQRDCQRQLGQTIQTQLYSQVSQNVGQMINYLENSLGFQPQNANVKLKADNGGLQNPQLTLINSNEFKMVSYTYTITTQNKEICL